MSNLVHHLLGREGHEYGIRQVLRCRRREGQEYGIRQDLRCRRGDVRSVSVVKV